MRSHRFALTPGRTLLASMCMIASAPAAAHIGTGLAGGLGSGFVHPLKGFDHLLAMVCVGVWGAFLERPLIYALPVVFPGFMVVGAVLGMFGAPIPSVEVGIAISVLILGTCIGLSVRAPVWAATFIVGAFAVFHGYAHGKELPSAADPIGYSTGFVLATGLLHLAGICIGLLNKWPRGRAVTRALGAAIGAAGLFFLFRAGGS